MSFPLRRSQLFIILLFVTAQALPADAQKRRKEPPKPVKSIYDIDTLVQPIPLNRRMFHDNFTHELRRADASDGKVDGYIYYGEDSLASAAITQAMLYTARHLDTMIENLPFPSTDLQAAHQTKIGYLRAITAMVQRFNNDAKYDPYYWRKVVNNMRDLIIARHVGKVDSFVNANANVYTMANERMLDGYPEARAHVYREVGRQEPVMMVRKLGQFAAEPFADDIIAAAARVAPNDIYNFASSTNSTLSGAVRRSKDTLVQTIVRIATESKAPLKAMSFVSEVYNKRLSIAEVDKITADEDLFYKALVRVKLQGDSLGGKTYTDELQYRGLKYVTRINELHTENNLAIRFKCLDGFTPEELYFLIVYGQDQIYTSSFIGAFRRMMERLKPATGDELFDRVHYEHFRTFIRMCAGYSTLSEFLATMKPEERTAVMRDFVSGLEAGKSDDLEDAVDVADAYGSISDSALADFIRAEIVSNYKRVSESRNVKGTIVYGLLATLANRSNDTALSAALRLPPITMMPNRSLVNDSGAVVEEFFFYGDEDGKASYASFRGNFKDGKWKVQEGPQWVTITSTAGKPIVVYANLPLDYEEGKDEEAQKELKKYLSGKNLKPSILVHRGHSYHLSSTIENMDKPNRVIILGSCGGYHNLGKVLDRAPDAHLISTKQTGTMNVNDAIIRNMNLHLLAGDDLDWIKIWDELAAQFKGKGKDEDYFREYVPPHRNLGAIFIKAYRRMLNEQEAG